MGPETASRIVQRGRSVAVHTYPNERIHVDVSQAVRIVCVTFVRNFVLASSRWQIRFGIG